MDFKDLKNIEYFHQVDLAKYTTIRLKKVGNICIVKDVQSLIEVKKLAKEKSLKLHMVGWGANQIIKETKNKLFVNSDASESSSSGTPSVFKRMYINNMNKPTKPMLSLKEIVPSANVNPSNNTVKPKGIKFHK